MTPFRLILALILASLMSQFPAFSNQYLLLMQAEIASLDQFISKAETRGVSPSTTSVKAEMANATPPTAPLARAHARLGELRPKFDDMRKVEPVDRFLHPRDMNDPTLLRMTWQRFQPSLPLGRNGQIAAAIGFVLGWMLAWALGFAGRRLGRAA